MNALDILRELRQYLKTGKANSYILTRYTKLLKAYNMDVEALTDDLCASKNNTEIRLSLCLKLCK